MDNSILRDLKDQLFDAPSDVKSAFNSIVSYFDSISDDEWLNKSGYGRLRQFPIWVVGKNKISGTNVLIKVSSKDELPKLRKLNHTEIYTDEKLARKILSESK